METEYSSYEEIVKDGGFNRGWVPRFLPKSCYDVKEKHDIDNNKVWLIFKFNIRDLDSILTKMENPDLNKINSIEKIFKYNFTIRNEEIRYYKYSKMNTLQLIHQTQFATIFHFNIILLQF